ncbi:MAG TPA: SDR family oxidoreductase [Methylomirabilota bacterium]|nr:SDR family oxidoreductase [Methylomirabilota bacterium]
MSARGPAAHVLVTGATGFLGRHVVHRLLGAGRPVAVLARPMGGRGAEERVAESLGCARDRLPVTVVEGDLAAPRAGLDPRALDWLQRHAARVVHCAGDTTFFPAAAGPFRAGHVEGPRWLLEALAAGGQLTRWVHVSTAFVCGRRRGRVLETEGDVGQAFHNPYERVKLESEVALRTAGATQGVDVRILRPAIIVGRAPGTAGGGPSALFFAFIRLAAMLGRLAGGAEVPLRVAACPRAPFNIVPVEYVAAAIAVLAEHPAADGIACHLVVPAPPTQAAMLRMIAGHLGVRGLRLVDGPPPDPTPFEEQVAAMLAPYREYLEQDVRFDDAVARPALAACGVPPPVLDETAVGHLVRAALATPARRPAALAPVSLGSG